MQPISQSCEAISLSFEAYNTKESLAELYENIKKQVFVDYGKYSKNIGCFLLLVSNAVMDAVIYSNNCASDKKVKLDLVEEEESITVFVSAEGEGTIPHGSNLRALADKESFVDTYTVNHSNGTFSYKFRKAF